MPPAERSALYCIYFQVPNDARVGCTCTTAVQVVNALKLGGSVAETSRRGHAIARTLSVHAKLSKNNVRFQSKSIIWSFV